MKTYQGFDRWTLPNKSGILKLLAFQIPMGQCRSTNACRALRTQRFPDTTTLMHSRAHTKLFPPPSLER
jgi:hypothetical protein